MRKRLLVLSDVLLAAAVEIVALLLALFVPVVCLFARWDKDRTTWTGGADYPQYPTWRGDLPRWAYIWSTPDERLPGDVRMPQTRRILEWTTSVFGQRIGRWMTSVWWLTRNRLYGLNWLISGRTSDAYFDPSQEPGMRWRNSEGIWRWWVEVGPVALHAGWKVHRVDEHAHWRYGPFVAVRFISFKRAR